MVDDLNYHHLRYFWAVAREGHLTRVAERLRVSQSALSAQIRQLEEHLGTPLFERVGRRLVLTETGKLVLAHADVIFGTGRELMATVREGRREDALRVGAVATLSRNFQESFVRPLLGMEGARLRLTSGAFDDLLERLCRHDLDVVLANRPVAATAERPLRSQRLARQRVSLVGRGRRAFRFPDDLDGATLILPGAESELRAEFDALCAQLGKEVTILAEVDDMAMMRLLSRDTTAIALVPSVVVRDELRQKMVRELCVVPGLYESFFAITLKRKHQHPLLRSLMNRGARDMLER